MRTCSKINTSLATLLRTIQTRPAHTPVTNVGALGVNVSIAAPSPLVTPTDPAALLATQFAELRRLQPDKPVLLMLDEAQTLVRSNAGDAAMKAIRALFNSHPGALLLLFTGSSKAHLMALVGDHSKTAFKLAAHMDFPLLGMGFVTFIAARIKAISQRDIAPIDLDWAFSQLLHRPGEMIDFARFMVTEVSGTDVRTALEAFKQRNQPDVGFEAQFATCTPLQQALLLEVAAGAKLFARDTRERLAAYSRQGAAVAPASVHNTLVQLEAKGLLTKRETRGHFEFEDDHLRNWIDHFAQGAPRSMWLPCQAADSHGHSCDPSIDLTSSLHPAAEANRRAFSGCDRRRSTCGPPQRCAGPARRSHVPHGLKENGCEDPVRQRGAPVSVQADRSDLEQ